MFELDDELLFKSIASLISDEASRIVSLGLAHQKDMRRWLDVTLADLFATETINKDTVLEALSTAHKKLGAVWLAGDFEKIAIPIKSEEEQPITVKEEVVDQASALVPDINIVRSGLSGIAYRLGSTGNHQAAYLVERTLFDIESTINRK